MKQISAAEWLDSSLLPNEIESFDSERKALYIPYEINVKNLNFLCQGDGWWSTKNFHHFFYTTPTGELKVSGSIDVEVAYHAIINNIESKLIVRTFSGAATFDTDVYFENEHWAATCKSLAIGNAIQVLGRKFGWGLNDAIRRKTSAPVNKIADTIKSLPTQ